MHSTITISVNIFQAEKTTKLRDVEFDNGRTWKGQVTIITKVAKLGMIYLHSVYILSFHVS